jgi:hypothetical protein
MDRVSRYRQQAEEMKQLSRLARSRELQAQWLAIAQAWEDLAEQQAELEHHKPRSDPPA